jgi:hypothetical protein
MSRGLGKTQRAVLAVLSLGGVGSTSKIATAVVGRKPTHYEVSSVSRALRLLVAAGLVEQTEQGYRLLVK